MGISIWYQALMVFGLIILIMGFFQYRKRQGDVIEVGREMARPSYWGSAILIAAAYVVLKVVFGFLGKVL